MRPFKDLIKFTLKHEPINEPINNGVKDGIKDGVKQLSDIQYYIISIIKTNPHITTKELAQKTNILLKSILIPPM